MSKLRELRKKLRKSKLNPLFEDEKLSTIGRIMPRDEDSLRQILSSEQADAFGDDILAITLLHSRDQAKFDDCILEMGAFVRGGLPGMELLDKVYPRIMQHYGVGDDKEVVLEVLKLFVHSGQNKIKRKKVEGEEDFYDEDQPSQKRVKSKSQ
jgi:hypothetical protein